MEKIDFTALAEKLKKPWTPIEIIRLEGFHLLLSMFEGTYRFHKHDAEELFFVLKGTVQVESKEKTITLKAGEGLVLPKGLVHRSMAKESALVIMFERTNLKTVFIS